jgi:hypothetical protein
LIAKGRDDGLRGYWYLFSPLNIIPHCGYLRAEFCKFRGKIPSGKLRAIDGFAAIRNPPLDEIQRGGLLNSAGKDLGAYRRR